MADARIELNDETDEPPGSRRSVSFPAQPGVLALLPWAIAALALVIAVGA